MEKMMKKLRYAAALVAGMFALGAQAEDAAPALTLANVGTAGTENDKYIELVDRGTHNLEFDGTYALIFTNPSRFGADHNVTFTFNSTFTIKEFLVVGGGGGGGGNCGGGGGGGGVIHLKDQNLGIVANSQISMTIGAGGTSAFKIAGTAGGHSTLTLGGTPYTAFGGGGGGCYKDKAYPGSQAEPIKGANGNTGCGAGEYSGAGVGLTTMDTSRDGYHGTNGGNCYKQSSNDNAGGGGGAGAVGGKANSSKGGQGGDGYSCCISGTNAYYAAGGGGGASNKTLSNCAKGGNGGGGTAAPWQDRKIQSGYKDDKTTPPQQPSNQDVHAKGYGCGGGGGDGGSNATNVGGNGSAGIVILLIEPVETKDETNVSLALAAKDAGSAQLLATVISIGSEEQEEGIDLYAVYGHDGLSYFQQINATTITEPGTIPFALTCLKPGTTYQAYVYATKHGDSERVFESDSVVFETTAEELGGGSRTKMPKGYKRLEYVASQDQYNNEWVDCDYQWVDTGIKPTADMALDIVFMPRVSVKHECAIMCGPWGDNWRIRCYWPTLFFNSSNFGDMEMGKKQRFTLSTNGDGVRTVFNDDGTETEAKTVSNISRNYSAGSSLALFADNTGKNPGPAYIYSFRLTLPAKNEVVMDLIPSLDVNGVACFYDAVSNTTYYSKTDVPLIAGPDYIRPYDPLTITASSYNGKKLSAVLARTGTLESDVYACYGATYGGSNKDNWEHADPAGLFYDGCTTTSAGLIVPNGTHYVRFFSELDGWSDTFFLPELAQTASTDTLLADVLAVRQARETSVSFAGYVAALGAGATSAKVVAEYGTEQGVYDQSADIWETNADSFNPSVVLDLVLRGLSPETHYFIRVRAENDQGVTTEWREFEATTGARGLIDATITGDESYVTKNLDTLERVLIFKNGAQAATFTVEKAGYAEVLLVGGGGGGGTGGNAAGGGAGGYLHYDNLFFPIGTYTITVGKGGEKGTNGYGGSKGGDTTISYSGDGVFQTITVYGGGGGDVQTSGRLTVNGTYGSTGGANASRNAQTDNAYLGKYQPTKGQGNYGGNGVSNYGGGGGGAGATGSEATTQGGVYFGGVGGDGLPSAITDEIVYYAGGGGACAHYGGAGGLGGGGRGYGTTDQVLDAKGVDGLGGGGGGGLVATINGVPNTFTSGDGGCGTVILRFMPEDDALATSPAVQFSAAEVVRDANNVPGVDLTYRVCSEGDGSVVTVDFEYGADEENLDHKVRLQSNAALGNYERSVTDLRAGVVYFGRVVVTDEKGVSSHSRTLQFTTLDGTDTVEPDAPRFVGFTYNTRNADHKVEITATGSNFDLVDDKTTSVKFYAGFDPLSLVEMNAVIENVADNEIKIFCDEIEFDAAYYGALLVDNGVGVSRSQPFAFSAPGQSVLLSSTYSVDQTAITFKGNVKSLGAGVTKARLYVSTVNANQLELLEEIEITQTGDFEFEPHAFEWDQTVYYRVDVANSFGTSSSWVSAGTAGNKKITEDLAVYTWNTEKNGGLWHDAANWTVEGAARGYPMRYATAKFPSGTSSENVASEIKVDQSQAVGFIDWGFSYGTVTFIGAGTTVPEVKMPDGNRPFDFNSGNHANVILDHIKMRGAGSNDHVTFGNYNTLTLKNGAVMADFGSNSQLNLSGSSNRLTITDGSRVALASATHTLGGTGSQIEVTDGGTFEHLTGGTLNLTGTGTALVISNGTFNAAKAVTFSGNNTSSAKIVLAGETPSIIGAGAITANNNVTGRIEFMVPVNGYETVPMVRDSGFNASTGTGKIVLVVPATAPAATAETDIEVVLISSPNGITTTKFTLAELPHPDTDCWIWTKADGTEAGAGDTVTGLKVHLVGRPSEPAAPVARGLHVKSSTAATDDETADATVTFEADFRCGGSSESATWYYKLDNAEEWTAIEGAFDQVENVKELKINDLAKGSKHTLHLKGVSSDNIESVTDYAFGTVGEVAELGAVTGVTAEPYGPYTRFVANASAKGTFEVLVAHKAEIDFGVGEPTAFTLNTGTYTIDGLTFANEGGVIYSAPANAEQMIIKVQTAEVKNEPTFGVAGLAVNAEGKVVVSLDVMGFGGTLTKPENPPESFAAKFVWGYLPGNLVYECDLGTVEALGTFAGAPLDLPESTLIYAKVVCDNGEKDGSAESEVFTYTIPGAGTDGDAPQFDEDAPFVGDLVLDASKGVALDAVFTAENEATYVFRTAATADMTDAVLTAAESTTGEDGKTTLTLTGLEPGAEFYVQVVAYAAEGGKCFATYPRLVTMPTAATFTTAPTVTSEQNTLTVTGSVKPGAGETWVIGEFTVGGVTTEVTLGHWAVGAGKTYTLNWSQAFENAWDQAVEYKITLKNSVAGTDYEWTTAPISGSQTLTDGATYTWTGASTAEGPKLWNDPSNWARDKETGVGYPTANSVARFVTAGTPDVALDQDRTVKDLTIGTGARVVFSGKHTFTLAKDLTLNAPRVAFGAVNEATVRIVGTFTANKANITNIVDNATLHVNSFKVNDNSYTLLISGAAPQIISRGHFGVCKGYTGASIQLSVPENGWTQPVIVCNGETTPNKKFGYTDQNDSTASFAFVVDPASPFLECGVTKTMTIVDSAFFFSVDNMVFDDNDKPVVTCALDRVTECSLAFNNEDPTLARTLSLTLCGPVYAQIGDVQYATLVEAIAAVQEGETIKLLDDLSLAEQVKVEGKTFVLDLGGKTVTFDGCDGFYFVGGEVTVQNGTVTMDVPATANEYAAIGFGDADGLVKDVVVNAGNAKNGVVCCSAGNDFNGKTVVCENVDVTGAGRNFYAETAAMTLDGNCSAAQTGHFAGGDAHSDALAAGWLGRLTVNGGEYSAEVNVVGTMSSPATITLNAGAFTGTVNVIPVAPSYVAMGEHNITKDEAVELAAPDGYKWDARNKLVVKVPVAEYKGEQYYSVEEAMEAAAKDDEPGAITIIADSCEEISGEVKDIDTSKEVVFVKENEKVVPVVQTSTAVMQAVAAGGKALTANTQKLRAFLTENEIKAYTADHTTAEDISAALAAVPTVEGNNGLALWKDYALGIEPTTPVKAVPPATDTDAKNITLEIPALKTSEGSGDFTIKYQVIDTGSKDLKSEAESADAIKIPLATGVYDVKIVFEIQEPQG